MEEEGWWLVVGDEVTVSLPARSEGEREIEITGSSVFHDQTVAPRHGKAEQ